MEALIVSDDTLIDQLVDVWHQALTRGETLTVEDLCKNHPHLLPNLRQRLSEIKGASSSLDTAATLERIDSPATESSSLTVVLPDQVTGITRFRFLQKHASGGLGEVWRAHDERFDRVVALKRIRFERAWDTIARKRFVREAEITAQLEHPGIAPVYGLLDDDQGSPCYAMRFIEGKTFYDAIREFHRDTKSNSDQQKQAFSTLLTQFEAICNTIAFAHSRGVIHRDLKPQNIMLGQFGEVLVIDWGLAKLVHRSEWAGNVAPSISQTFEESITQFGQVIGTPAYMSPEQARGENDRITSASDIFSLGAILYHLLTGKPPNGDIDRSEVLEKRRSGKLPPVREVKPDVPKPLAAICEKALSYSITERYSSAKQLAEEINAWKADAPVSVYRPSWGERFIRWQRRHRPALKVAIVIVFLALVVGGVAWNRINQKNRETEARNQVLALESTTAEGVPFVLERLMPLKEEAFGHLKFRFDDLNVPHRSKVRLACGLAACGEVRVDFLFDAIPKVPLTSGECQAIISALKHTVRDEIYDRILPFLLDQGGGKWHRRPAEEDARYAIVFLGLGNVGYAQHLLCNFPDPVSRTSFIHTFPNWYGDLIQIDELLRTTDDANFRSGICATLGLIDPSKMSLAEFESLSKTLIQIYHNDPNGNTHSAAQFALRKWNRLPMEEARTSIPPKGNRWFINESGITLIRIEPGTFQGGNLDSRDTRGITQHTVTLTKPYWVADRETSVGLFKQFLADTDPTIEKPSRKVEYDTELSPTDDCPIQSVDTQDIFLFCNWLSKREARTPCYVRVGPEQRQNIHFPSRKGGRNVDYRWTDWHCRFEADGYRLPTDAEWEYACRAGSETRYSFGNDESLLPAYAHTSINFDIPTKPEGSLLPNAWGLFDMHGNVWEACWDWYDYLPRNTQQQDPKGPRFRIFSGLGRVYRGGAVSNFQGDWSSSARGRGNNPISMIAYNLGFRVVCNDPLKEKLPDLSPEELHRLAREVSESSNRLIREHQPLVSASSYYRWPNSDRPSDATPLVNFNLDLSWFSAAGDHAATGKPVWIEFKFPKPVTVERVTALGNRARMDGQNFYAITRAKLELYGKDPKPIAGYEVDGIGSFYDLDWILDQKVPNVERVRILSVKDQGLMNADRCVGLSKVYIE